MKNIKKFTFYPKVCEFLTDIKNVNKNATFVNERLHFCLHF